jgi:hypothetical protein
MKVICDLRGIEEKLLNRGWLLKACNDDSNVVRKSKFPKVTCTQHLRELSFSKWLILLLLSSQHKNVSNKKFYGVRSRASLTV